MLLIHPPLTKPCEPPAPLAYLSASLKKHGHPCTVCDMNIEGLHYLLQATEPAEDTWSQRAFKHLEKNLATLRSFEGYGNHDRYGRAVSDLNRVLEVAGRTHALDLSLANYQDRARNPLESGELVRAAAAFQENIFFPFFKNRLTELVSSSRADCVGFSLSYLSQALCTFSMIGFLKDAFPKIKIILGGGLVTTWLAGPRWQNHFSGLVDHFVRGRGEGPLLEFLGTRQKEEQVLPDYSTLRENEYLSPGFVLPYTSSFGCYWKKCSFCPETSEDNPYQHQPPEATATELIKLTAATSPGLIHLLDNAVSPSTLEALSKRPPGAAWYGFARIGAPLTDRNFCQSLKDSGCCMLKLGLESGDQGVLDQMHKGVDLLAAEKVLTNLHEVGIATYIYLLFGTPSESLAEARRTQEFVEKRHRAITFLNLAIFNLPVCSGQGTTLELSDFYEGDLSMYRNFSHPRGWNRGDVRRFLDTGFKKSPKIAEILRGDPPIFTSNHAPFFLSAKDRTSVGLSTT